MVQKKVNTQRDPSGIALICKPSGMTSFDCVKQLKRAWNRTDLGHGGTLDRFATGVLPILVGEGLKLARFFLDHHPELPTYWKSYRGVLQCGYETDTGDPTGEKTEELAVPSTLSASDVQAAMSSFSEAAYLQRPPVFSAKKIQGHRASDLARAGKTPELKAVEVWLKDFNLISDPEGLESGCITFNVTCSKGTYIRVLAEDLARRLGTRGHLITLERTSVGHFSLNQTVSLDVAMESPHTAIHPLREAAAILPTIRVSAAESSDIIHGRLTALLETVSRRSVGSYCLRDESDSPVGLIQCVEQNGTKHSEFLRAFVPDLP